MERHKVVALLKVMDLVPDPQQACEIADRVASVSGDAFLLLVQRCTGVDDVLRHLKLLEGVPVNKQAAFIEEIVSRTTENN